MAKMIRFSELVKISGRPTAVTLWVGPEQDATFRKAVMENRVMTVKQKTVGTKKDFGTVGFTRGKNVSYLVFPKPLPKSANVRVVGIKYDLLDQPGRVKPAAKLPAKPKKAKADQEFVATVKRTAIWETIIQVCAKNLSEAKRKVEKGLADARFSETEAVLQNEIRGIHPK